MLIDNGLQIDPGYQGHVYVVVHNLTNESRPVFGDERFLSVEFVRTTPFRPASAADVATERDLIKLGPSLTGLGGEKLEIFKKDPDQLRSLRDPSYFWRPGERHKSSTLDMAERISALEKARDELEASLETRGRELETKISEENARLSKFRTISFLGALGGLLAFISICLGFFYWFSDRYSELVTKTTSATSTATQAADGAKRDQDIKTLNDALRNVQERLTTIEKKKP